LQSILFELQSLVQIHRENHESLLAVEQLKYEVITLKAENEQLILSYKSCISSLNARLKDQSDDCTQLELDL